MSESLEDEPLLDEFRRRWHVGDCIGVEAFLAERPDSVDDEQLLDLVAQEILFRDERQQVPVFEEYANRFPLLAEKLRTHFEVYAAIRELPGWLTSRKLPCPAGYEVIGILGRGGMGVVYQALHLALNRTVALKMLLPEYAGNAQGVARLRTEAQTLARLQHPNIVQIFEVGECEGLPFFSMEYCSAGSLDQQLDGKPLPSEQAAALLVPLTRAVQAAHEAGVVHRDLKPANVLLSTPDGKLAGGRVCNPSSPQEGGLLTRSTANPHAGGIPKIADYGIARALDRPSRTATGAVLGTPCYMSPEQANGRKDIGPPTDIYSLGAMLYECLTGRPPFGGPDTMKILLEVVETQPMPPSRLAPVPRDLETICLKCLQKEPAQRYHSAAELADDLERFLAGKPIRARRVGALKVLLRWTRRNPLLASLSGVLVLVALVGFILGYFLWRGQDEQRNEAEWQQYVNDIGKADAELREARPAWARRHLDRCPKSRRGWEWYHLDRLANGESATTWKAHRSEVYSVAVSPDGTTVASVGDDSVVRLWLMDATLRKEFKGHKGAINSVAFSSDGITLASGGSDGIAILWDITEQHPPRRLDGHRQSISAVAFHPSGQVLATATADLDKPEIYTWDVARGNKLSECQAHDWPITALAFSPDGKQLASSSQDRTVSIRKVGNPQPMLIFSNHEHPVATFAFSPDRQHIASCAGRLTPDRPDDCNILLWKSENGQVVGQLTGHSNRQQAVAFTPDGTRLASAGMDKKIKIWNLERGQELLSLRGHTDTVTALAFSPDGTHLVSCGLDGTIRVWKGK